MYKLFEFIYFIAINLFIIVILTFIGIGIQSKVVQPQITTPIHRIAVDSLYKLTKAEENTIELKLPADIIMLKGSSFIADVEMDSIEIGDQVIVIMLKREGFKCE